MGAISIKTTEEMDIFLLSKRTDLKKKGIEAKGSNHVVLYILDEAMKEYESKIK